MLKEKEAFFRKLMIALDALVICGVFLLAYELRENFHALYKFDLFPSAQVIPYFNPTSSDYLVTFFLLAPLWCLTLYLNGMYASLRTKSALEIVWIIVKAAFLTAFAFGSFVFIFKLESISRVFLMIFMLASSLALTAEKALIFLVTHNIRKEGYNFRRLVIVGTGRRASDFIHKLKLHPEWGLKISGIIDFEKDRIGSKFEDHEVIGALEDIPKILRSRPIDEVIFIVPRARLTDIENYIYACETAGVKVTVAVDFFELKIARLRQTELDGIPLITFETTFAKEWQLFIKRAADFILSGLGIIILSPLLLAAAVLVKITSSGPVLYLQKRVGLNGRKFILYKFRSMYKGAHMKLAELIGRNEMQGPVFKIKNDPRVAPLGRFLRKFSIDELPQLFNVFLGQMSLVGPRPPLPKEVNQYEPWQRRRLSMRPGITCLWQISGRNKIGFEEWMKLDLEYLDNWSLWLDFKILMKTIPVVVFGKGAY